MNPVVLSVPVIVTPPPATVTVKNGALLQLAVTATDVLTYQWNKDGSPIPGATSATYTVTASPTTAGSYTVTVTNAQGSVTTTPTVVTVSIASSLLVDISARSNGGTGDNVAIGGFVLSQGGTVLLRAVGPTLTTDNLPAGEVMADPTIELHDAIHGNVVIATNDNWVTQIPATGAAVTSQGTAAQITATAATVGAQALASTDSTSSVLLLTLQAGVYSFVTRGTNNTGGIVLTEVYAVPDNTGKYPTLADISVRSNGGTGDNVSIGGFVISGIVPKTVLLRAVGPTLTTDGLPASEVMTDPNIELHDAIHGNAVIATNDNWTTQVLAAGLATGAITFQGAASDITAATTRIGAQKLDPSDSTSAALLITLNPGVYSFIVRGNNSGSGIVLTEVYDGD